MTYAGQRKVFNDIERKAKRKSTINKMQKIFYYAKLLKRQLNNKSTTK